MPYVFGVLVILNALMLGYYIFFPQAPDSQSLQSAQSALVQPIAFENSSAHVPPLIGTKK